MMLRQEGQSKFLAYQLCGTDRELGGAYGYRHVNNGVRQLILPKEGFEAVFRGMDPHLARKTLAKKGMLEKAGRDLQVYRALPGSGKTKCTVINLPMDFTPEASIL